MSGNRWYSGPIAIVAAVLAVVLFNPWFVLDEGTLRQVLTVAFWVSFLALLVVLFQERREVGAEDVEIEGPAFTRFLFHNSKAGLFWLPIRLFLGFNWLEAGWHKATSDGWINNGGSALAGFWKAAVAVPDQGHAAITYDWYRDFLNVLLNGGHEAWFAWLITFGEMAVGLGLIFGCLTGIAAFFGALMNMSFLLAGSASTNPVLFTMAIGIILAWRVAGYYGIDRYLLPALGAPWRPGKVFGRQPASAPATT